MNFREIPTGFVPPFPVCHGDWIVWLDVSDKLSNVLHNGKATVIEAKKPVIVFDFGAQQMAPKSSGAQPAMCQTRRPWPERGLEGL